MSDEEFMTYLCIMNSAWGQDFTNQFIEKVGNLAQKRLLIKITNSSIITPDQAIVILKTFGV